MQKRVHSTNMMSEVTKHGTLDAAFNAVRKRRLHNSPHSDIWSLSLGWGLIKNTLRETLLSGHYQLSPAQIGCAYFRYMDDWVILTKSRSVMRRHVKKMHQVMQTLKFKLAKDKTFIGKISSGFDFLGYRFNESGRIGLALKTIQNFNERYATLYEQGANQERLSQYVHRWVGLVS